MLLAHPPYNKKAPVQVRIFGGFVEGLNSVSPWAKAQTSLAKGQPCGWWVWNQQSRVFRAPEGGGLRFEFALAPCAVACVLQSRMSTFPPSTTEKETDAGRYIKNAPVTLETRIKGRYFMGKFSLSSKVKSKLQFYPFPNTRTVFKCFLKMAQNTDFFWTWCYWCIWY